MVFCFMKFLHHVSASYGNTDYEVIRTQNGATAITCNNRSISENSTNSGYHSKTDHQPRNDNTRISKSIIWKTSNSNMIHDFKVVSTPNAQSILLIVFNIQDGKINSVIF